MTHEQLLRIYVACNPDMVVSMQTYAGIQTGKIHNVNTHGFTTFYLQNDNGSVFQSADAIKPHLKPLSSITDEDAIAVAKMAFKEYGIPEPATKITVKNVRDTEEGSVTEVVYKGTPKSSPYIATICHDYFMISFSEFEEWRGVCPNSHRITDYLRSKSYNLDFEEANYIKI